MRRAQNGFTLIETMLVIALIGTLTALTLYSLAGARERGRDTARIADLERLGLAVDMYYETCREYPASLATTASNGCPSGTTLGSYIPSIPTDPRGASYSYSTSGAGNGYDAYVARAELESVHAVLTDDIDGATHDGASLDCTDALQLYYCIGS